MSDAIFNAGTCVFLALIPLAGWFFFLRNTGERAHSSKWKRGQEYVNAKWERGLRDNGDGDLLDAVKKKKR